MFVSTTIALFVPCLRGALQITLYLCNAFLYVLYVCLLCLMHKTDECNNIMVFLSSPVRTKVITGPLQHLLIPYYCTIVEIFLSFIFTYCTSFVFCFCVCSQQAVFYILQDYHTFTGTLPSYVTGMLPLCFVAVQEDVAY